MKNIKKKFRYKSYKIGKVRKARKRILMDFETCGLLPIFSTFPQSSTFEGVKKGEFVILTSKTKYAKKQKYIKNEKEQREESNNNE